jgi:hypothetical protein
LTVTSWVSGTDDEKGFWTDQAILAKNTDYMLPCDQAKSTISWGCGKGGRRVFEALEHITGLPSFSSHGIDMKCKVWP